MICFPFQLRRACNINNNGTDYKPRRGRCRTDEACSLGPIGIEKDDDVFLTATYCEDSEEVENWLEVLNGERGDDSSEGFSESDSSEGSDESDSSEGYSESDEGQAARRRIGGGFRFGPRGGRN